MALSVLGAPIAEETLFRGILYAWIRERGYPRIAAVASSVLFGLVHFNMTAFIPLSLFGLSLAWLYRRTGNLASTMVAHAVFNLAPFVAIALGVELDD